MSATGGVHITLLCFLALTCVQVSVGVVYKLSQTNGGYSYSPASALATGELIKLCMSVVGLAYSLHSYSGSSDEAGRGSAEQAKYALLTPAQPPDKQRSSPIMDDKKDNTDTRLDVQNDYDGPTDLVGSRDQAGGDDEQVIDTADSASHTDGVSYLRLVSAVRSQLASDLQPRLCVHLVCLAALYALNNHVAFVLFLYVDPASISLFKSWATGISAVILYVFFARPISGVQWGAILLQVIGLIISLYDPCKGTVQGSYALLIFSVFITAVCSVWNEQVVKKFNASLYSQNIILYTVGSILNLLVFFLAPASYPAKGVDPVTGAAVSYFAGYTPAVLGVIACNSLLGLAITVVYKYADAIIKTFASATGTGVLLVVNTMLFATPASLSAFLGVAVVFIASYIYLKGATEPAHTALSSSVERQAEQ